MTTLAITPWTAPNLPTARHATHQYALRLHGAPGGRIRIRASGLASGWLATFCTQRVCSLRQVSVELSRTGSALVEFALVHDGASRTTDMHVRITTDDGASLTLLVSSKPRSRAYV